MAAAKRKKPHPHEYDDEHEVISITDDGQPADDVDSDDSPPPPQPVASTSGSHKARKPNHASSASTTNGKGKGKQRAEPEPEPDAMPVDAAPLPPRPTASARENERLRKLVRERDARLQDALAAREALQRQVEELTKLRTTDAERSRDELRKEYDARVHTLEKLVQEQTAQLARVDKIARGSRGGAVHFITREVAAEERRGLERELTRVKAELAESSSSLKIAEEELKLERQSAKKRDTGGGGGGGGGKKGGDDARHHEWLVRFYEDGTNLLVTNIKPMASTLPARPQFTYMCLFTPEPGKSGLSLNFSLQTYLPDGASEEKFIYTPLGLEHERPEYVDQLDFFRESFQFKKAELPKFLRQLNDVLTSSNEEEEEDDE